MLCSVTADFERLSIRVGGLLHMSVARPIAGFQSWIDAKAGKWCIQFTTADGAEITGEYSSAKLWEEIVKGVDRAL